MESIFRDETKKFGFGMSNPEITITRITQHNIDEFCPIIMDPAVKVSKSRIILGAIVDNIACGVICIYFPKGILDNPVLEYLYVSDDYRKKGIATRLLEIIYKYVKEHNYRPIQFYLKYSDFGPFLNRLDIEYENHIPFIKINLPEDISEISFVKKALSTPLKNVYTYDSIKYDKGFSIILDKYIRTNHINTGILESDFFCS